MTNKKEAILVTGGSGFLGTEVCRQLIALGKQVINVDHKVFHSSEIITISTDITDFDRLEAIFKKHKASTVIHLAALLNTTANQNPSLAFRVNVLGSGNLLELAHRYGVRRFVYSSSFSILGNRPMKEFPVDESIKLDPRNFYGETKRFVEILGMRYAALSGFQFIAVRMGALVGPGKVTSTSAWRMDIFNLLKTGGRIEIKNAPQVTLAISIPEETARAIVTLALSEHVQHNLYHLPHDLLSFQQIADLVKSLRKDIEFSFGTFTEQDMPPLISTERFSKEFINFEHVPLAEALKRYQKSQTI